MADEKSADKNFYLPAAILIAAFVIGGSLVYSANMQKGNTTADNTNPPVVNGSRVEFTITENDHIRGNPNAEITLVEFSDLECPFCKAFHPTAQQALDEYGDKIRWVYKHFPLDNIHPKADKEAEAAECAGELGGNDKFWEYVDRVFEATPSNNGLDPVLLPQMAQDLGLDRTKFEACLNSGKYASRVEADYQQGLKAGVTGTPGSFLNGVPVRGAVPYAVLKATIDAELK
ncbi:MAG: DsbA family protein [Candidatus Wildermuthbacteria bacterium]|nr:DsbA family protein [Candidatus Wildermuthbacteria bacterium]